MFSPRHVEVVVGTSVVFSEEVWTRPNSLTSSRTISWTSGWSVGLPTSWAEMAVQKLRREVRRRIGRSESSLSPELEYQLHTIFHIVRGRLTIG
jgi:hypothetical protein